MKKNIFLSLLAVFALVACRKEEQRLLDSKVYFENPVVNLSAEDINQYEYNLTSRVSTPQDSEISVEYKIGGEDMIASYNQKYGTKYQSLPKESVELTQTKSTIKSGNVYSEGVKIVLKQLDQIEQGNTYLVPISITHASIPTIEARNTYLVLRKPITISKVMDFNGQWLSLPMPQNAKYRTLTMEALIYADVLNNPLKTIMGREGRLLLRFGDLPQPAANQIQIAGGVQYNPAMTFEPQKWYHVAFVADGNTKQTAIYVNGEKVAEKTSGEEFDLSQDCFIGYAYDYDPRRIWHGKMSECRIWTVARTATELREGMLGVDSSSEGLLGYWKLDGTDVEQREGKWFIKDQTKNKLDAISRRGTYNGGSGASTQPRIVDMKVKL